MEQVVQGLSCLLQPDNVSQREGLRHLEQLKGSVDGWQLCLKATLQLPRSQQNVHFYCLQVLEHYLKSQYGSSSVDTQRFIHSSIRQWIINQCEMDQSNAVAVSNFLLNKMAQICAIVFVADYPDRCPAMLVELAELSSSGPTASALYLRALLQIDIEIVDREMVHSQADHARNTVIKDSMRVQCVPQLVESWLQLVASFRCHKPHIANLALEVIGKYISWIDIDLVANERVLALLMQCLQLGAVRVAAVDCVADVLAKGMEPAVKARLVEWLYGVMDGGGVFAVAAALDDTSSADDVDFAARVGRLLAIMGTQLLTEVLRRLRDEPDSGQLVQQVEAAVWSKLAPLLQFLNCAYDEPSAAVIDFARDYVQLLKTRKCLSDSERALLTEMTRVVFNKLKYDAEYDFDADGEDEAEFERYRRRLKVLYDNLASVDRQLVLQLTEQLVTEVLCSWRQRPMPDIEAAISLLYMMGEALPPVSAGNFFSDDSGKATVLQHLMHELIVSDVVEFPHHIVPFQYFETVCRYDKYFTVKPDHIPKVLSAFVGDCGINHSRERNSARAVYLFCRFVKALRCHLEPYTERLLELLAGLLAADSCGGEERAGGEAGGWRRGGVSRDDQLYLYESTAVLIVSSVSAEPQLKLRRLQQLLAAPLENFRLACHQLSTITTTTSSSGSSSDQQQQQQLQQLARHAISAVARTTKAFSSSQTMHMTGTVPLYLAALQTFLEPLQKSTSLPLVQSGVVQFLHRLVLCLEEEILPLFPPASRAFLKVADVKRVQEYLPLINQVVAKYKTSALFHKEVTPFLSGILMSLVEVINSGLVQPADDQVNQAESQTLLRSYYTLLSTLVCNGADCVLTQQTVADLCRLLMSVVNGASDCSDPVAQRSCFTILRRSAELWGGTPTTPATTPTTPASSCGSASALYPRFMYDHIVPVCLATPLKPMFDLSDAQTQMTLNESANCVRAVYLQRGDELLNFLQSGYMRDVLSFRPEMIQSYSAALRSDVKGFRKYTKSLFQMVRS